MGPEAVMGGNSTGRNFDVRPDGKRLVIVMRSAEDQRLAREVEVVLNWTRELRNR